MQMFHLWLLYCFVMAMPRGVGRRGNYINIVNRRGIVLEDLCFNQVNEMFYTEKT